MLRQGLVVGVLGIGLVLNLLRIFEELFQMVRYYLLTVFFLGRVRLGVCLFR